MMIIVNGKGREVKDGITVAQLLSELNIDIKNIAVELNLRILNRSEYESVKLKENDKVEVVLPVGGGMSAKKSLVIVESPAKSKTINKFLGDDYVVCSSMGHVIDLPTKKMGVDVKAGFKPEYVVIPGKKKILKELKKEAKDKDRIYIATDPDREGEAIGWHLANHIGKDKEVWRVVFEEITKRAVEEAFKKPGHIDLNLVNAQQARRILDRIVGYSLSPLLWKKISRGLSAGRVQSVAVRLIVDREREIKAFIPQEYWEIEAELRKIKGTKSFNAKLEKIEDVKAEIKNKEKTENIIRDLSDKQFKVKDIKESKKRVNPQAPFTTSKLQQEAFYKLNFRPGKTMRIAQQLYEGLEVGGEGSVGLITYMRTDSVRVASSAIEEVRDYVNKKFGHEYLPPAPNIYKSKKAAQEAHEAIRPTSALREPDSIKDYLTADQYKLYKLIWARFVSSQMKPALYSVTSVDIEAGKYLFKATGSVLIFAGFKVIYDEEEEKKDEFPLPPLEKAELLELIALRPSQHFTKPPARYTDASLVKALEEEGIGRPSTYAPIIETVVLRHYVKRDGGSLVPTELGTVVTDLLIEHFPKILDIEFTARMEEKLDEVEEGKLKWTQALDDFYGPFTEWLSKAHIEMKEIKKDVIKTDERCEQCGRIMVIKWGRRGKFLSCSGFPKCRNAKPIGSGVKCPEPGCDGELIERRSRRGVFYGCSRYPNCRHIEKALPTEEPKGE